MANTTSIRFLQNVVLESTTGEQINVDFGNIYLVDKLVDKEDGYFDIYFENGNVVNDVSGEIFGTMGKVRVETLDNKEEPVNEEPEQSAEEPAEQPVEQPTNPEPAIEEELSGNSEESPLM